MKVGDPAMARLAARESVGVALPGGVVIAKRTPQGESSPAVPPVEAMQALRMSPKVLMVATGTVSPGGTPVPGAVPVDGSTNWVASVKALVSAAMSAVPEPTAVAEAM